MTIEQSVRELLAGVGELVGRLGSGEHDAAPHELAIILLFDRCRSTFGAVRLLLEHRFAHEAVMLGRPLLTESLMLAELAAADNVRKVELVVGWWMAGLADLEGMIREGQWGSDDAADDLAAVAARRAELSEYARKRGAQPRHWKPNEKALADAHGRRAEYLDFRLTHHFVHGSTMAAEQRMSKPAHSVVAVGGPAANLETWATPAGLFAAYSMLHASAAICRIFAWDEPPEITELLHRADDAQQRLNAS